MDHPSTFPGGEMSLIVARRLSRHAQGSAKHAFGKPLQSVVKKHCKCRGEYNRQWQAEFVGKSRGPSRNLATESADKSSDKSQQCSVIELLAFGEVRVGSRLTIFRGIHMGQRVSDSFAGVIRRIVARHAEPKQASFLKDRMNNSSGCLRTKKGKT